MKARKENGKLIVRSDFTKSEVPFKRTHAVITWGNPDADDEAVRDHALVVGGEMENGRIYVLNEYCGGMDKLMAKAVEHKEELLISYFHVPPNPPGLLQLLYDADGLT